MVAFAQGVHHIPMIPTGRKYMGFNFDSDTGAADWRALGAQGMENENGCKHQRRTNRRQCPVAATVPTPTPQLVRHYSHAGCQVPARLL